MPNPARQRGPQRRETPGGLPQLNNRLYTSEPQRNRAGVVFHCGDRVKILPTGMTGVIEEFCVRPDRISVLILTDVPDAIEIAMLEAGVITSGWRSSAIEALEPTDEKQGAQ